MNKELTTEKAKSKSVTLTPSLWNRIDDQANRYYGSNRSNYIRNIIEEDLNGKANIINMPSKADEAFFVDLCEMLAGHTATERAKKAFEKLKIDQRTFLEHILKRAAIAALWLSKHPDAKFDGLRFHHKNLEEKGDQSLSSDSNAMVI